MMGSPFGRYPRDRGRAGSPERNAAEEERAIAALSYMFWPLALPTLIDGGDGQRSPWLRQHAKQAAVFGAITWVVLLLVFSLPFTLLMWGLVPFEATITLYGFAFILDLILIGLSFGLTVYAARRAARGEHFGFRDFLPIAKKDLT